MTAQPAALASLLTPPHDLQALFRRAQLKALVDLHRSTEGLGGQLADEEINVIRGALDLTNKTAMQGMTGLDKVGAAQHGTRQGVHAAPPTGCSGGASAYNSAMQDMCRQ